MSRLPDCNAEFYDDESEEDKRSRTVTYGSEITGHASIEMPRV